MYDLRQLTTQQLARLYRKAYDRMARPYGYQMFGFDRQTLRLTDPGWLDVLDAIRYEGMRR